MMRGFPWIPAPKPFLAPLLLLGALGAQADEFSGSVPVDLVRLLTNAEFYRELPPGFPPFAMPAGLSVIGAQARQAQYLVLLRSAPEGPEAQQAVVDALMARGWIDLRRESNTRATGFVIPSDIGVDPADLCHDEHGVMQVRGETGVENRVYLGYSARLDGAWQSCEDQIAFRQGRRPPFPRQDDTLLRHLPDLQSPETRAAGFAPQRIVDMVRSGSGPQPFETEAFVTGSGLDIEELNEHYARQLREQDWRQDADWAGELSGGSQWTRSPEDDLRLFLSLSISELGEDVYSVVLRMEELE